MQNEIYCEVIEKEECENVIKEKSYLTVNKEDLDLFK